MLNGYDKTATKFTRGSYAEQAAQAKQALERVAKKEAFLKAAAEKAAADKSAKSDPSSDGTKETKK